jgi:AcrR family transcriptional regulator
MRNVPNQEKEALSARERLLQTAHRLFYKEGIRATGIDRIIAEAEVTKVTFYRHFPSKNDLVCAYLEYRHSLWIHWFDKALERYRSKDPASPLNALVLALKEWFNDEDFRGCAFINGVGEVSDIPRVPEIARHHKKAMAHLIAQLLPSSGQRQADLLALAVDGAIVRAQIDGDSGAALQSLREIVKLVYSAEQESR